MPKPGMDDQRLRRFWALDAGAVGSIGDVGAESVVVVGVRLLVLPDEPVVLGEL